jgi:hypothetical protein
VVVADLVERSLLSPNARRGPRNAGANLPAVVGSAAEQIPTAMALADAGFGSESNHTGSNLAHKA